jgi:diguanylate cyclase (GGDEF)-like protein
MLIVVDEFKIINDNAGHESGDSILQYVTRVFEGLVAGNGHVIRMGGDEFAVIFADLDPSVIARRGLKILRDLTQDHKCQEVVNVHFSIGVASVPPEIEITYRQLYKQADMALYKAKDKKGGDLATPNIVVSVLHDPDDVFNSTQRLWIVAGTGAVVVTKPTS